MAFNSIVTARFNHLEAQSSWELESQLVRLIIRPAMSYAANCREGIWDIATLVHRLLQTEMAD